MFGAARCGNSAPMERGNTDYRPRRGEELAHEAAPVTHGAPQRAHREEAHASVHALLVDLGISTPEQRAAGPGLNEGDHP